MNVISVKEVNNLYKLLNIPENSRGCMPMAGRLTNKKEELNRALFTLIKVLNDFNINQKGLVAEDKIKSMMDFFKAKENPKQILEDIKVLNVLIPNLSDTNIIYNVFDKNTKKDSLAEIGINSNLNDDVSLGNTSIKDNELQNNELEKKLENEEQLEQNELQKSNNLGVAIQNNNNLPSQDNLPGINSLNTSNQEIPETMPSDPSNSSMTPTPSLTPTEPTIPIEATPTENTTPLPTPTEPGTPPLNQTR